MNREESAVFRLARGFLLALLLAASASRPASAQELWVVLKTAEAGRPLVVSARQQMPDVAVRRAFGWATTIQWRYGNTGNGMPPGDLLDSMYALQGALQREVVAKNLAVHAVTRTGNGLREWTYYVTSRQVAEDPIATLVKASPADAITVTVREEPEWTTLHEVISSIQGNK